ncbi:MAG: hypothetical protein ACJ8H8_11390 [Geminicoccaceae bacterium]
MRHATIAATLAAALLAAGAGVPARAQQPGVAVTRTEALTGTVESVNLNSREVVLRDQGGRLLHVVAGPEARNLAQLRPGDRVAIEYREAVAVEMVRPGDPRPPVEAAATGERAPEGARPGGTLGQLVRVRVSIDAVDAATGRVTFTGPAGGAQTVTAQDPRMVEFVRNLRPGEEVDVTYTEALALRVEPAP